jgi:dynein heavy chain
MASGMGTDDRRWMIFDGPVDAIWIENMNTVLDDNKKLCLMSGEVISMSANMNMIFEPMDLAAASPATVSRCGMVYLQPHEMGWDNLFKSWKNNLPSRFDEDQFKIFDQVMYVVVQPCIDYVRKEAKETTPTEDQNLVVSLLRLWRALLKVYDDENVYPSPLDKKETASIIESCFLFSLIWSVCISVNTECRRRSSFTK